MDQSNHLSQYTSGNGLSIKQQSQLRVNVPLAITSGQIIDHFNSLARSHNFEVIESDSQVSMAIHRGDPNFSLSSLFKNCIPFTLSVSHGDHQQLNEEASNFESQRTQVSASQPTVTAVRISVNLDEIKCSRRIVVRKVYGHD